VENVLYEHPDIDAVAVVAMPDPRLQERACACVVLKADAPDLTFEAMREFLAEKGVAKPYWPERLVALEGLPRTASGKIQKFQLRERVGSMQAHDARDTVAEPR
jgi:cyclohexanecarboxylate-CoA ligase